MKKNFFKFAAIAASGLMLFSCSSSDDKDPTVDPKDLLELPYSSLTPTQQKQKLATESSQVNKLVKDLPNEASAKLLASFRGKANELFYVLDETGTSSADITRSIVKLSQYYGEYEWDAKKETWNKTSKEVTDKLVAKFPATEKSATNDGKLEVKAITSTVVIENHEIPSNVVAELFVSDAKVGEVSMVATGINESTFVETALLQANLGSYKLVTDLSKKGSENVSKVEFTKGSDEIMSAYADLDANITQAMIANDDISSVKDGNAKVVLASDVAAAGYVDGKSLLPELRRIEDEEETISEKYGYGDGKNQERENAYLELEKQRVKAMNDFSNLALVSTKEEYKIAKISIELDVEEESRTAYKYDRDEDGNPIWETEKPYEYTEYHTSEIVVLHFNDNTKVEASVFFGEGFNDVIKLWSDFVQQF